MQPVSNSVFRQFCFFHFYGRLKFIIALPGLFKDFKESKNLGSSEGLMGNYYKRVFRDI